MSGSPPRREVHPALRVVFLLALLYVFLVAIGLMASSFSLMGRDSAGQLFAGVENPFAALAVGIMATVLVQSSSVTTATIVALCGSGELPLDAAVPMVMGANIGTTVTNTLVSVGSVRRSAEFRRAFACATVHDVFNFASVAVLLPLELATGYLKTTAVMLTDVLPGGEAGGAYKSPIKAAVKAGGRLAQDLLEGVGFEGTVLAIAMLLLGIALVFQCLHQITKQMRRLLLTRIESSLNRVLGRSGVLALLVGAAITVAVQSSSITTSLLVPLCGAGILALENAYPITLGANLGTTVTALLASLAADHRTGLSIALVHLLFNLSGTLLYYPLPAMRKIPLRGARRLALLAVRSKLWLIVYVIFVFVVVPLGGILLFG